MIMSFQVITTLIAAAALGAALYRMRGGSPTWPRPIEQCLFCLVFLVAPAGIPGYQWYHEIGGYILAVAGCCAAHGQWMSLGTVIKYIKPERFDFIISLFFGRDPRSFSSPATMAANDEGLTTYYQGLVDRYGKKKLYWRCVAGLGLSGVLITAGPGLMLALAGYPLAGLILGLCGATKAPGYMVSWKCGQGTAGGECLTGAWIWTSTVIIGAGLSTVLGLLCIFKTGSL